MSVFTVRFYGRFVFAQSPNNSKQLRALAVQPTFNKKVKAKLHTLMMTARQVGDVTVDGHPQPNLRLMSGSSPQEADNLVWRIDRGDVRIGAEGGFSWKDDDHSLLADLVALSPRGGGVKGAVLQRSRNAKLVRSIITLDAGVGTPKSLRDDLTYDFVQFGDPTGTGDFPAVLADMVEVTLERDELPLEFTVGAKKRTVTLRSEKQKDITVSFSNLCTQSHEGPDTEFAGLYEVLKTPPPLPKRLIPTLHKDKKKVPGNNREFPFGDCFLAGFAEI